MTTINQRQVEAKFYTTKQLESELKIPIPGQIEQIKVFQDLKKELAEAGLFNRRYVYYFFKTFFTLLAQILVFAAIYFLRHQPILQLLLVIPYAFVAVQLVGLVHDAGHRAIFKSAKFNDYLGLAIFGPFGGVSYSWWYDKHNLHHASPNEEGIDPDINFPVVAFTKEQAKSKKGFFRWVVKYQTIFYLFLVSLVPYNMRIHSLIKIFRGKSKYPIVEFLGMLSYFLIFFAVLLNSMSVAHSILFFILSQAFAGWYLASIFAPNHKGMPALEKNTSLSFMWQQVITSRNVRSNPLTDFVYLGLNYQIEHHLFPNLPQCNMHAASLITAKICHQQKLPYHQTSVLESYKEIYQILKDASSVLLH